MPCDRCLKPDRLCVCQWIQPVQTRTRVLILQHPQEADKELGSAHLARLCLPNAHLTVGLSWPNLQRALEQQEPFDHPDGAERTDQRTQPKDWLVLYLGSAKDQPGPKKNQPPPQPVSDQAAPPGTLTLVNRKGRALPAPTRELGSFSGLVVLDGSWSQAKTLWWRNAWLVKLQRAMLAPRRPSLYQQLRREPRRASLSTIEAIALSLSLMEDSPALLTDLLAPFQRLLELARESSG